MVSRDLIDSLETIAYASGSGLPKAEQQLLDDLRSGEQVVMVRKTALVALRQILRGAPDSARSLQRWESMEGLRSELNHVRQVSPDALDQIEFLSTIVTIMEESGISFEELQSAYTAAFLDLEVPIELRPPQVTREELEVLINAAVAADRVAVTAGNINALTTYELAVITVLRSRNGITAK